MKATKYFFGLLALALCAACSDSETVDSALETDANGNTYMSIYVSMGGADTRASQSHETGSDDENYVDANNSVLLFYDTYGSYMGYGKLTESLSYDEESGGITWSNSDGTGVAKTTVVTYGLSMKPTQVFAVFNYSKYSDLLSKSLSDVITITTDTTPSYAGDFLMTNALRVVEGEFVRAAKLDADCIYSSEEEAESGTPAATIYVEREIAKVKVGVQTASTDEGYFQYDTDSTYYAILPGDYTYGYLDYGYDSSTGTYSISTMYDNVKAKVVIKGWAINATNDEGYITKNYNSDCETALSNITDSDEYSYWVDSSTKAYLWAVDPNYDYAEGDDYTIGTTSSAGSGTSGSVFDGVTYLSWNEVVKKGCSTDAAYYHENTADAAAQGVLNQSGTKACTPTITLATQLLVVKEEDEGTYSTIDFQSNNIYYRDGVFYSNLAVGALAMTQLTGYYLSDDGGESFISSDVNYFVYFTDATLDLVAHDNNSYVQIGSLALADGYTAWYSKDGTTDNAVQVILKDGEETYEHLLEAINSTEILKIDDDGEGLECFYLGYSYYQAPIKQISYTSGSYDVKYNGIVRNHSYHLTLNKVSDLGQGVYDPDEEIVVIPGDEEKYYLSCTVNILKWVAKSQTVDF